MSRRKGNSNSAVHTDGYYNAFVAHGLKQYQKHNSFPDEGALDYYSLQTLWGNRLAQRVSSLPAEAAVKNGFKIEGDEDNLIIQHLDTIGAEEKLIEALTWARHFGRSCIFMIMDDGGEEMDPVNWDRLQNIKSLEVYDKQCIIEDFSGYLINDDPSDTQFGKPEWYQITPPLSGRTLYIHHSRLLIFDGDFLPTHERIARGGGGMSCLEGIVKAIRRSDTAHSTALNALERVSISLTKLKNLGEILSTTGGDEKIQKRLDLLDMAKNILNTMALSTDDEYQVFNVPMTGIPELLDSFGQYVSALSGIPFTVLFGRAPAGLNSTGDGDLENYYNDVCGKVQRKMLKPKLEQLIKTVQYCKQGPTKGKELESWNIKFNPLWVPTEKEVAETEKLLAEKDEIIMKTLALAVDKQMLDPSEGRNYLRENLKYPIGKTSLDLSDGDNDDPE